LIRRSVAGCIFPGTLVVVMLLVLFGDYQQ
jgi:hypothetical protein